MNRSRNRSILRSSNSIEEVQVKRRQILARQSTLLTEYQLGNWDNQPKKKVQEFVNAVTEIKKDLENSLMELDSFIDGSDPLTDFDDDTEQKLEENDMMLSFEAEQLKSAFHM